MVGSFDVSSTRPHSARAHVLDQRFGSNGRVRFIGSLTLYLSPRRRDITVIRLKLEVHKMGYTHCSVTGNRCNIRWGKQNF